MYDSLSFVIKGEPVAKGRPRGSRRGKKVHFHTPKKTQDHEELVAGLAREAARLRGWEKVEAGQPLSVEMSFAFKMPKSWSVKKRSEMEQSACCKKPDLDNLIKILDGINNAGNVWHDDNQVTEISAVKYWSETPGTGITIYRL